MLARTGEPAASSSSGSARATPDSSRQPRRRDRSEPVRRFVRTARHPVGVPRRGRRVASIVTTTRPTRSTTSTRRSSTSSSPPRTASRRRGPVRRARFAARRRAHGRPAGRAATAGRRRGRRARRCRSSIWPGSGSASTRSTTACAWSTGTASPSQAAGERGPLLVAHCHNRRVLSDIKLAVDEPPTRPVTVLQRLGLPDEAVFEVAWADLDRSCRARPPHRRLDPRAGRAGRPARWRASSSWCATLARASARGTASRPTPASPGTCSRRPTRCSRRIDALDADDGTRATTTSRRSSATCCSRSCSTPRSPPRQGGSRWPTSPGASTTSSCRRHPHVFGDVEVGDADDVVRELGADQEGGEGPDERVRRHPGRPAGAALRAEGAEEGDRLGLDPSVVAPDAAPMPPRRSSSRRRATTRSATCCSASSASPAPTASTPRRALRAIAAARVRDRGAGRRGTLTPISDASGDSGQPHELDRRTRNRRLLVRSAGRLV